MKDRRLHHSQISKSFFEIREVNTHTFLIPKLRIYEMLQIPRQFNFSRWLTGQKVVVAAKDSTCLLKNTFVNLESLNIDFKLVSGNIGSTCGFLTGFSFVSVLEFIYFFTVKLFREVESRRKKTRVVSFDKRTPAQFERNISRYRPIYWNELRASTVQSNKDKDFGHM